MKIISFCLFFFFILLSVFSMEKEIINKTDLNNFKKIKLNSESKKVLEELLDINNIILNPKEEFLSNFFRIMKSNIKSYSDEMELLFESIFFDVRNQHEMWNLLNYFFDLKEYINNQLLIKNFFLIHAIIKKLSSGSSENDSTKYLNIIYYIDLPKEELEKKIELAFLSITKNKSETEILKANFLKKYITDFIDRVDKKSIFEYKNRKEEILDLKNKLDEKKIDFKEFYEKKNIIKDIILIKRKNNKSNKNNKKKKTEIKSLLDTIEEISKSKSESTDKLEINKNNKSFLISSEKFIEKEVSESESKFANSSSMSNTYDEKKSFYSNDSQEDPIKDNISFSTSVHNWIKKKPLPWLKKNKKKAISIAIGTGLGIYAIINRKKIFPEIKKSFSYFSPAA